MKACYQEMQYSNWLYQTDYEEKGTLFSPDSLQIQILCQ